MLIVVMLSVIILSVVAPIEQCTLGNGLQLKKQGTQAGWPDDSEKNRPIFWKVAKTVAKTNNAKVQNLLLYILFWWKCYELVAQDINIFGTYCINEPTKSSLSGDKLPNLVTLYSSQACHQAYVRLLFESKWTGWSGTRNEISRTRLVLKISLKHRSWMANGNWRYSSQQS
jgi:hypothetical protein